MRALKSALFVLLIIVCVGSLAANVLLYRRYSATRPLLRIGADGASNPATDGFVTRKEYQDRLDYLYGKQVLNKLTFAKIIRQAALKGGFAPTEKDVDYRLALVERQQPTALETVNKDPERLRLLREDTWTTLALENLRIQNVKASDAEVKALYRDLQAQLRTPLQVKTTLAVAQNKVDADGVAEMLRQKITPDVIARRPRVRVAGVRGWEPDWTRLPPVYRKALTAKVNTIPQGGVAVIPMEGLFFIVQVQKRQPSVVPSLASVRPEIERRARLLKAEPAQKTVARLFEQAKVEFEVDRYAPFFEDVKAFAAEKNENRTSPTAAASAGQ